MKSKKIRTSARKTTWRIGIKNNWQLYVLFLPVLVYFFVFSYMPMYGAQIAFRDYKASLGIWGSEWVGFKHFLTFFDAYYFERLLKNTLLLNVLGLLFSFPVPIILAILLNRVRNEKCKRFIQTTIYAPHFISTVVLVGMLYIFLSPTAGIFNVLVKAFGGAPIDFMSSRDAFRPIYILSGIWQSAGYESILYIATLAGIDSTLYEAADIDGASIWQKIRYIDIPALIPTAMMVFILDCGKLLASNTNKVLVMQTAGNTPVSDIIGTYVYDVGLGAGQFSYTTAIGLLVNIINFILILTVNKISKSVSEVNLF